MVRRRTTTTIPIARPMTPLGEIFNALSVSSESKYLMSPAD